MGDLRRRTPTDRLPRMKVGDGIQASLLTKDIAEPRSRHAVADGALVGLRKGRTRDPWAGPSVDAMFLEKGLVVDEESRHRLIATGDRGTGSGTERLRRNAAGDRGPAPDRYRCSPVRPLGRP